MLDELNQHSLAQEAVVQQNMTAEVQAMYAALDHMGITERFDAMRSHVSETLDSLIPFDLGPFVVGQTYRRPVVKCRYKDDGANGIKACTNENCHKIGYAILHLHQGDVSSTWHYHLDVRFLTDEILAGYETQADQIFGRPYKCSKIEIGEVQCVRATFPTIAKLTNLESYRIIEEKCKNRVCTNDICPHQAVDLSQVIPNFSEDGKFVKTCPCHGLQWDVLTGKMVPRISLEE